MPSGGDQGMFPGRYSEIFGLGERLGCILNLGHSFDAIEQMTSVSIYAWCIGTMGLLGAAQASGALRM